MNGDHYHSGYRHNQPQQASMAYRRSESLTVRLPMAYTWIHLPVHAASRCACAALIHYLLRRALRAGGVSHGAGPDAVQHGSYSDERGHCTHGCRVWVGTQYPGLSRASTRIQVLAACRIITSVYYQHYPICCGFRGLYNSG